MESNQAEKDISVAESINQSSLKPPVITRTDKNTQANDIDSGGHREEAGKKMKNPSVKAGTIEVEAYWIERKKYLQKIKKIPELHREYCKSVLAYLIRRFLWSFTFFPVFIAFWIPLVLNRFNLVVTIKQVLPSLQAFIEANPQSQAATVETLFIAWFSIGITFAIFDFILTPFKNPYTYEADVHMRAWEELQTRNQGQDHA